MVTKQHESRVGAALGDDSAARDRWWVPAFVAASGLSYVSHAGYSYSMVVLARDASGSDAISGSVYLLIAFPPVVFSLLAGALADGLLRHRFLCRMQCVLAVMTGLPSAALLLSPHGRGTPPSLAACAIVYGLASCWITPVRLAFAADLAPGRSRERVMISVNVLQFVGMSLGPVLASFVATSASWATVFAALAAASATSGLAMASIRGVPQIIEQRAASALERIADGVRYVASDGRQSFVILSTAMVGSSLFGPVQVLLPALGKHYLGLGERARGLLMTPLGIGFLLGAALASVLAKLENRRAVLLAAAVVAGGALAGVGMVQRMVAVAPLIGVVGTGAGVTTALTTATLGRLARAELRGRVMAIFTWTLLSSAALGGALAGVASARWGAPRALIGLGAAVLLEVLLLGTLMLRSASQSFIRTNPPTNAADRK